MHLHELEIFNVEDVNGSNKLSWDTGLTRGTSAGEPGLPELGVKPAVRPQTHENTRRLTVSISLREVHGKKQTNLQPFALTGLQLLLLLASAC